MTELPNPYGGAVPADSPPADLTPGTGAGGPGLPRRVRIHHLREMKSRRERFSMLTAYDQYSATIFEEAGIPVLLVGDSAANNVFGYQTTVPVTMDEMLSIVRAVTRATNRALVVADLPFGSYQAGPQHAMSAAIRMMKEGQAHAVKMEGGQPIVPAVELLVSAGIPVMGHLGFTPQSEHALGGYRVQGRGASAEHLVSAALALQEAGAFAIVLEMVPSEVAEEVTRTLEIPTIGIGAGPHCDAQVLVWQDMMGLRTGKLPRFVKRYAQLHDVMLAAAQAYDEDVRGGSFPTAEQSFENTTFG